MTETVSDLVERKEGTPLVRRRSTDGVLQRYALLIAMALVFALFTVLLPGVYATAPNLRSMLGAQAVTLILCLAIMFPLRSGEFDLSAAANMLFCAVILGKLTSSGTPVALSIVLVLLVGTLVGVINAFFIVGLKVNAFLVTLGTMTLFEGFSQGVTGGALITGVPEGLLALARTQVLGLPTAIWIAWLLAAVVWYVFNWTPFGRHLLFVGGNSEAALFSGVPVNRTRAIAFMVAGLLSALAGVVLAGRLGAVDPTIAGSYLLPPYSAAFLGTAVIQLGRFNVVGSVIGVYFITFGVTGLLLLGSPPWVSDVFNGAALVAAVTAAQLTRRERARRRRTAATPAEARKSRVR